MEGLVSRTRIVLFLVILFFTRLQGATSSPALANRNYIGCCLKPSPESAMHWRHRKMYVFKLFVALHWFLHNLFHSLVMSPTLEIADLQVQPSQSPPPFPPSIILNDATAPTEVVICLSTPSNTSITQKKDSLRQFERFRTSTIRELMRIYELRMTNNGGNGL